MNKKRLAQGGFSAFEAVLIVLILAALGLAGWLVWDKNKKSTDKQTSSSTSQKSNTPAKSTPEAKPTALEKYCDPIENSCLSFSSADWEKKTNDYVDTDNQKRANVTLTSKKHTDLAISFMPYVYGVGWSCSETSNIAALTKIPGSELSTIKSSTKVEDITNGVVTKTTYSVQFGVVSDSIIKKDSWHVGQVDCGVRARYDNKHAKYNGFGQLQVIKKSDFATQVAATEWLSSAEAKEVETVLQTIKLN